MSREYSPNAKSGELFEAREALPRAPTGYELQVASLKSKITDLELCLKGNPTSKRWQEINVEINKLKGTLLDMRRRLAGRTPQMESWADPLPG